MKMITLSRLNLSVCWVLCVMLVFISTACGQIDAQNVAPVNDTGSADVIEVATFVGGYFWCTESDFDKLPGVISTTSGYIGGTVKNPRMSRLWPGKQDM